MPTQPPRFAFVKREPRKAWQPTRPDRDKRKRGRPQQRERLRILADEPLCRPCLAEGRTTASAQVDHIIPLSQGGSDDRDNKQGICLPCHRKKTALESSAGRRDHRLL